MARGQAVEQPDTRPLESHRNRINPFWSRFPSCARNSGITCAI